MSAEGMERLDERIRDALDELQGLIKGRYPGVTFTVSQGEDPPGIYLRATIDVEDVDEVVEVFGDRLLELQVEERLPIYVIPLEPVERVIERMRVQAPGLPRRYNIVDFSRLNP